MKRFLLPFILLFTIQILHAQLPPWNLEFYVYHPDGQTDTLWVGCDENATAGYDEGLDIIDTTFNTPIAIRGFSQEVEDEFNFGTCVNLKKDIRPFGYPAEFTFYILHDEISTSDSVYLGWDTSMLNYEVGDYWIEGAIIFGVNGYIEGIDGETYLIFGRDAVDSTLNIYGEQTPIFVMGEYLSCIPNASISIMKIYLEVYFKDYGVFIKDNKLNNKNLTIYPNPSINQLQIQSELLVAIQTNIYNFYGQLIDTILIKPGKQVFDISNFPSGIYYLSIAEDNSNKSFTYKFIKL
ncbi:MAG: T9SS type A sorting domain-containing protein [Bacteroidetes bacterium]|nr:T9SS type A sorting domain-containing protein [Bacteroidota bacterium]MBK8681508.1 T9SS type A sorting domain-containing protein [Bacteroidota bacterium]